MLSHQSQLWAITVADFRGPRPLDQRLLVAAPLFHMNTSGTSKFAMASHASVVLMPQFNARHYVETISSFRCTYLTSVPTMLALACRERDLLSSTDLTSVRSIRMGSAPVTGTLLDEVRAAFPKAEISNVYGTTEAGPVVFGPDPDGRPVPAGALGWPRPRLKNAKARETGGEESDEGVLLWQRPPASDLKPAT